MDYPMMTPTGKKAVTSCNPARCSTSTQISAPFRYELSPYLYRIAVTSGLVIKSTPITRCYTPRMKFKVLQENLRKILWDRIEAGELTGLRLAQQTGFKQAHISNFLNRKRGLSLEGMDKVLQVQHLSVLDLLDPAEVNKRASILPPSAGEFENIVLADASIAACQPFIASMHVKEILKFKKSFLHRIKPESHPEHSHWQRFVLIRLDAREALAMHPRLVPGALLLIDRHYNSLKPYRKGESNMYAVLKNDTCVVRYVELAPDRLVLRPHNHHCPIEVVAMPEGKSAGDYVIGRVCHIGLEA